VTLGGRLSLLGGVALMAGLAMGAALLWGAAGTTQVLGGALAGLALAALLHAAPTGSRPRADLVSREGAEALFRDRTAELEKTRRNLAAHLAQLEAVHLQLDVADRLVAADRLARGLTHELNNPLAILLADVEFAFEELVARASAGPGAGGPPDEVISALDEARQAGRRISLLVRELASFSRDRSAADLGPTDLAEVLAHAERLAGPEIRRHARFIVALPPGPILVQGHQARLGLAFLELLHGASSAVAAAGRPDGLVTLALRPEPDGAVVEVRDDGVPISDDLRLHLFDPSFTPTASFAVGGAGQRGTGLGLASCFGIIQAAGGRLDVDSAEGSGTVFRAWLPAASTRSRVALRTGLRDTSRGRLLVVDADPFDCATAYRALSRDFDVAPHTSVSSALAILRSGERFDLILCDAAFGPALAAALAAEGSSQAAGVVLVGEAGAPTEAAVAGLPRLEKPLTAGAVLELARRRAEERGQA
jgi:signal transduction histidine kinase